MHYRNPKTTDYAPIECIECDESERNIASLRFFAQKWFFAARGGKSGKRKCFATQTRSYREALPAAYLRTARPAGVVSRQGARVSGR